MKGTVIFAHRGFSGRYPENTMLAFEKAVESGADGLETDVRLARDGSPVLIHDPTADRTTDGTGAISGMDSPEIRALDAAAASGGRFSGCRVPLLREFLERFAGKFLLNLHLKPAEGDREDLVEAVLEEAGRAGAPAGGFFLAADEETLALARGRDRSVTLCNLSRKPPETYLERSLAAGCRIVQPSNRAVDAGFVAHARALGIRVNPYFADEPEEMRRLIGCGVDGILTNRPDILAGLARR